MERRDFLKTAAAGAAAAAVGRGGPARAAGSRPNIVVILADDMGYADVGCYGSEISTPNIDRLAAGGLRFTQFYNCARCCPTRASLLTGLHPHQAGVGHMTDHHQDPAYAGHLNERCVTLAEAVKPAGYKTFMTGKWHVGAQEGMWPTDRGFDEYYGMLIGSNSYYRPAKLMRNDQPVEAEGDYYTTDVFTDHAIEYIRERRAPGEPYLLYQAYNAPHWPLHARDEDIAKYEDRYLGGWDELRAERRARQIELGIGSPDWTLSRRDRGTPPWKGLTRGQRAKMARKMAVYAAMVDRMDQNIGRLVGAIEAQGELDNTLILFLSDNGACHEYWACGMDWIPGRGGFHPGAPIGSPESSASYGRGWSNAGNTPFRLHKHWVHEGGISTPLIAHWPAVVRSGGGLTGEIGHIIDIMATCVDVSGSGYPESHNGNAVTPVEGKSLLPVLASGSREGHDHLCWEHEGNRGVRRGDWKIVSDYPGGFGLFNLAVDRTETTNLARQNPDKARELAELHQAWAARVGVRPWNPAWALQT